MHCWKRTALVLGLLAWLPLVVGCGGGEPEPAMTEEAAAGDQSPALEPEPTSDPVQEEPSEPEEPQLVGNITLSGENFEWGETDTDNAAYTWMVDVVNDTTQTLDIIVSFRFLDDSNAVVKRERKTVRLDPASRTSIREAGSLPYADANRIFSFAADYDYRIISG